MSQSREKNSDKSSKYVKKVNNFFLSNSKKNERIIFLQ